MGKVATALQVALLIPVEPSKIKSIAMAQKLEVSERTVMASVNQLRMAGIDIESTRGKHGGYYIPKWGRRLEVIQ